MRIPVEKIIFALLGLGMLQLWALYPLKKIIAFFEGERLTAYKDSVGKWTIGIGHLILPHESHLLRRKITPDESHDLFVKDSGKAMAAVKRMVKVPLTANMLAALTSFTFNLGVGALASSTLLKRLNAMDYKGAADEFLKWNKEKINGEFRVSNGLTKRRIAERELFLKKK